ncbi:signal transduction histidine kinase [Pseudomonas duriflava]|uniref:histidine kinase n=1 Tax=Pseudomonas duriflava TaxID=459528 RepID=A0A562QC39_9PSED|nr:ATP-binding protein [Pseudomonas duriflava]TWI54279.1 signal transduction histidine kinase [Pseudomonas duriflava]
MKGRFSFIVPNKHVVAEHAVGSWVPSPRLWTLLCAVFGIGLGLVNLTGWAFDIGAAKSLLPGFPFTQPITAMNAGLVGLSLLFGLQPFPHLSRLSCVPAALVAVLCLLTLIERRTGLSIGIDSWFFPEAVQAQPGRLYPGLMSEVVAWCYLFLSGSLLTKGRASLCWFGVGATTLSLLIAVSTLLAYLFETSPLYGIVGFSSVAIPTALALTVLSLGVLMMPPVEGWVALLVSDTLGGREARRLLPFMLGLPVVINWIAAWSELQGWYSELFLLAAVATCTAALLGGITLWSAQRINAVDSTREYEREQRAAAEEALRQNQKMQALGQMTGGVAHDFNNLLTVMSTTLSMLERPDLPDEKRQQYVAYGRQVTEQAASLTHRLLAFSRQQPLALEVFEVGERIHKLEHILRTSVGQSATLSFILPSQAYWVKADTSQFDVALLNLVINARDAVSAGRGHITVQVYQGIDEGAGSQVAISVTDNGTGIEPAILSRLFEPFFTTKGEGQGTGLGLPQVYGFARQSGGDIHVESEVGKGSCFTLSLPIHSSDSGSGRP